jgi:hypothetical protein
MPLVAATCWFAFGFCPFRLCLVSSLDRSIRKSGWGICISAGCVIFDVNRCHRPIFVQLSLFCRAYFYFHRLCFLGQDRASEQYRPHSEGKKRELPSCLAKSRLSNLRWGPREENQEADELRSSQASPWTIVCLLVLKIWTWG